MKKVFLVFALAVGMLSVKAQDTKPLAFGIKAGLNLANLKGTFDGETESMDMKFGYHVGAFARIAFSESLAFQPELLLSLEGGQQEEDGEKYVSNLTFLNVPLMLQFQSGGFFGEIGPGVGLTLSAKDKYEYDDQEEEDDVKEYTSSTNITGNIGIGYVLPSGFGFGARYVHGFSNMVNKDYRVEDMKITTSNFQISIFKRL